MYVLNREYMNAQINNVGLITRWYLRKQQPRVSTPTAIILCTWAFVISVSDQEFIKPGLEGHNASSMHT